MIGIFIDIINDKNKFSNYIEDVVNNLLWGKVPVKSALIFVIQVWSKYQ